MEKQTKNLGHVTAYGYAKSQGYEGTEAEYAALMASYATVAERAEAAADEAEASAQEVKDVIPEVTSADNGKVMMVENGAWGAGEVDVLPTVTSQDNGKVLGVVEGQWAKTEPEDGLPSVTSSDNGKVLSVVEGAWAPAEPTGGSGLPEVTSEDNGDLLSVVDGAWAKSEPVYRVSEVAGTEIVPEQSVTAEAQNAQAQADIGPIPWYPEVYPEAVVVVIDGTQYALEKSSESAVVSYDGAEGVTIQYAAMDAYFSILMPASMAGTHTISVSEPGTRDVVPTEDFKAAVNACGAPGYDVGTEEVQIAAEQSVTTAAQGTYITGEVTATFPDPLPDSINVTFNGTSYENVPQHADASLGGVPVYGDSSFVEYPFVLVGGEDVLFLVTQTAGTYTIAITGQGTTVTPDTNFKAAVKASGAGTAPLVVNFQYDTSAATTDKTFDEILAAWNAGQSIVFNCENYPQPGPAGYLVAAPAVIYDNNGEIGFQANYTYVATLDSKVYTIIMSISSLYTVCYYTHT